MVDGAIVGAVGSAVLNVVSYFDMTVRARPASTTPETTAGRLAKVAHVSLGPAEEAAKRQAGLGPVLGYATGIAAGAAYGLFAAHRRVPFPLAVALLGGGVMAVSDSSMTLLGVTDPRTWRRIDWASDLVPHLAYGVAAAATWRRLRPSSRRG